MKLTTPVQISTSAIKLNYKESLMLIGSCFAQNIGEILSDYEFNVEVNPHSILFNPVSIANSITDMLENKQYHVDELTQRDDLYVSYYHHSSFSSVNADECIAQLNERSKQGRVALQNAHTLIITFGTAWVYKLLETDEIVANCHKMPAKLFQKVLLKQDDIVATYTKLIKAIRVLNPNVNIVFTISPVRHIKDGVVENSLSKAILLSSIHDIIAQTNHAEYFPSYEIMMDELRDYRFYKPDLIHPSEQAVQYIWQKFQDTYFDLTTVKFVQAFSKLKLELNHTPLQPNSKAALAFKKGLQTRVSVFEKEFGIMINKG